jgi:hypothetical protein
MEKVYFNGRALKYPSSRNFMTLSIIKELNLEPGNYEFDCQLAYRKFREEIGNMFF